MFGRLSPRLHALRHRTEEHRTPLTREQTAARERWQRRCNLPILLAATIPLVATSPRSRVVELAVGIGSWVIFVVDLYVKRRIVPDYLSRPNGRVDLADRILTFPYYLIPAASNFTASSSSHGSRDYSLRPRAFGASSPGWGKWSSLRESWCWSVRPLPTERSILRPMNEELAALRSQLQAVDRRLGQLAQRS